MISVISECMLAGEDPNLPFFYEDLEQLRVAMNIVVIASGCLSCLPVGRAVVQFFLKRTLGRNDYVSLGVVTGCSASLSSFLGILAAKLGLGEMFVFALGTGLFLGGTTVPLPFQISQPFVEHAHLRREERVPAA